MPVRLCNCAAVSCTGSHPLSPAPLAACPVPQVLQRMLGERYMYHKKTGKGDDPSNYHPYYIDMSERSVLRGAASHSTLLGSTATLRFTLKTRLAAACCLWRCCHLALCTWSG